MTAAAFQAEYADWKLVKTRKVVQIVFEVPVEKAGLAYDVLGGMPNFGSEVWCAIARLKQPKENEAQPRPTSPTTTHPGGAHTKKSWPDMAPAQQAGILCDDPAFAKFMEIQYGTLPEGGCAERVRIECQVGSRGDIKPGTRAAEIWSEIVSEYRAWMREPAVVPA